jgi:hypothetical protein
MPVIVQGGGGQRQAQVDKKGCFEEGGEMGAEQSLIWPVV